MRHDLVRCPPDAVDGLQGCGAMVPRTVDPEGWVDCPNCGLWFRPRNHEDPGAARTETR